jgi:phage-related tail protein
MMESQMSEIGVGHNNPPSAIEVIRGTAQALNIWMMENPAILSEDAAREAKVLIDRGRLGLKDMEAERDGQVRPLNEQVAAINETYRQPRNLLGGILAEIERRLSDFLRAEEAKRRALAEAARLAAEEAESAALEAERLEQERLDDARSGELGVDLVAATEAADQKFEEYQKAQRAAALAEKEAHVKIGGGFGRAIGLRSKEVLVVTDAMLALKHVGVTEAIEKALLSAARSYKKLHSKLPPGIECRIEEAV